METPAIPPARPARSGPSRTRKLLYDIHLWVGLILGLPLIVVAVTGALLVWHDGLDDLLHPERRVSAAEASAVALLPASAYEEAARAALPPGTAPMSLTLPARPGDAVVVSARGLTQEAGRPPLFVRLWLEPQTAAVLDRMDNTEFNLVSVLHRLHGSLMIPQVGRPTVGWLGVAMALSCITGLWLWWPGRRGAVKALGWRRGLKTSANLHHVGGIWILLPLFVVTVTGIYISFPQTGQSVLAAFGAESPERGGRSRFAPPLADPALTATDAVAAAQRVSAEPVVALAYPTSAAAEWRLTLRSGEVVVVGDGDGGGARLTQETTGGMSLPQWIRRIHDGQGMGIVWQTFVFATGVLPAVLTVTGLLMWLRKRRNRKALERRKAEARARAAARA